MRVPERFRDGRKLHEQDLLRALPRSFLRTLA
jgi:hypothetical protein